MWWSFRLINRAKRPKLCLRCFRRVERGSLFKNCKAGRVVRGALPPAVCARSRSSGQVVFSSTRKFDHVRRSATFSNGPKNLSRMRAARGCSAIPTVSPSWHLQRVGLFTRSVHKKNVRLAQREITPIPVLPHSTVSKIVRRSCSLNPYSFGGDLLKVDDVNYKKGDPRNGSLCTVRALHQRQTIRHLFSPLVGGSL